VAEVALMVKSTGILLVIAAVLAALYFSGSGATNDAPAASLSISVLDGYTVGRAARIEIVRGQDAPPLVIEQIDGRHWITEPIRDRASMSRLTDLAKTFDSALMEPAYPDRTDPPDADLLARTGLDRPQASLRLEFPADGAEPERDIVVHVGAAGPLNADVFLMRDGEIFRGGRALATSLAVNVTELRERLVFDNSEATAQTVSIRQRVAAADGETVVETLRLERAERGAWRMVEPVASRTDPGEARRLIQQILALRVEDFLPGAINVPAEPPTYEIEIEGVSRFGPLEDRVRLWRRPIDDLVYGVVDGRVEGFTAPAQLFALVFQNAVDGLRARFLVPFSMEELQLLTIDAGGDTPVLSLRRDAMRGFKMVAPYAMEVRATPVAELSQALRFLYAESFVDGDPDDARFGLVGGLKVLFQGGRAGQPVTLRIGLDDGDSTYCRREDEAQVVRVPRRIVDLLRRPWVEYAGREVLRLAVPPQGLTLAWQTPEGRVERHWRRHGGEWRDSLQRPLEGEDGDQFRLFLEEFIELEADDVIATSEAPQGREVTISLTRENGEALVELVVTVPDPEAPQGPALARRDAYPDLRYPLKKGFRDTLRWLMRQP